MRALHRLALGLLLGVGVAGGEEALDTPAQAADKVLAAFQAKDREALKAVAERDDPDPWLVADELCFRGEHHAAREFAGVAPRPDTNRLPEYVETWGDHDGIRAERKLLEAVREAEKQQGPEAAAGLMRETSPTSGRVSEVELRWELGVVLKELAPEEAGTALLLAADRAESIGWLARVSTALEKAGDLFSGAHQWDQAKEAWGRRLSMERIRNRPLEVGRSLGNLGNVHEECGEHSAALGAYGAALEIFGQIGDADREVHALVAISGTNREMKRWSASLMAAHRAYLRLEGLARDRVAETQDRCLLRFAVLWEFANTYQALGDPARALPFHRDILALLESDDLVAALAPDRESSAFKTMLAGAHVALALDLKQVGQLEKARDGILRSLEVGRSANDPTVAHFLLMWAAPHLLGLLAELGNDEEVAPLATSMVEYMEQMLGLASKGHPPREGAAAEMAGPAAILLIGFAERYVGEERALSLVEQTRDVLKQRGVPGADAFHACYKAGMMLRQGRPEESREFFREYLTLAQALSDPAQVKSAKRGMAAAHLAMGEPEIALQYAREAIAAAAADDTGLPDYLQASARDTDMGALHDTAIRAAIQAGEVSDLLSFSEWGRAGSLVETLSLRESGVGAQIPDEVSEREQEARRREARAAAAYKKALQGGNLSAIRESQQALEQARQAVVAVLESIELETRADAASSSGVRITLAGAQAALADGECMVLLAGAEEDLAAVVATRTDARLVKIPAASAKRAREASQNVSQAIMRSGTSRSVAARAANAGDLEQAVAELRGSLAPVLKALGDSQRILLSPYADFAYTPFCLLLQDREIAYIPSATTNQRLRQRRKDRGEKVLAVADPELETKGPVRPSATLARSHPVGSLPGARSEAEALADKVLVGSDASEAGLREVLGTRSRWRAVHFACHGVFNPEWPLLSSLALTPSEIHDGYLTAHDVFRLEVPADLVVLSACETAKGRKYKTEGLIGLPHAFMVAGAQGVIVSLWKVDDEATRALMVKFYELWNPKDGSEGLPAATALKRAQEYVASHEKWKHPYYWAAWQLWGLPD